MRIESNAPRKGPSETNSVTEANHVDRQTLSVIIVTWRRAPYVMRCLESLGAQDRRPDEVVVVDASEDYDTRDVVRRFPSVHYVHFPGGAGHMTTARNQGLLHVTGDVIAFLDDDTKAYPLWAARVLERFKKDDVAAVVGRTLNGIPDEDVHGVEEIGRLYPDGRLSGNFAARPGGPVELDHGIGANMAFCRDWLARLGGFRDDYPGTAIREDADIFLRIRRLGGRVVFDPLVEVDHLPAPHVRGQRFDLRYAFFAERNHVQLLATNFGPASSMLWRYIARFLVDLPRDDSHRRPFRRSVRSSVRMLGLLTGLVTMLPKQNEQRRSAVRSDTVGCHISAHLMAESS